MPEHTGMILSGTSDGRLIFILPYQGYTLVGTTDDMQEPEVYPKAQDSDVTFLKQEMQKVFGESYDFDSKLKAKFAGLRPLCLNPPVPQSEYEEKVKTLKSKDLTRSHIIETSPSGLISLLGGKWTSYRIMGEETVDEAIKVHNLKNTKVEKSNAFSLKLLGCYTKLELRENMSLSPEDATKKYKNQMIHIYDIPEDVANHLIKNYGVASLRIVDKGKNHLNFQNFKLTCYRNGNPCTWSEVTKRQK